jgi:hypothetical protein
MVGCLYIAVEVLTIEGSDGGGYKYRVQEGVLSQQLPAGNIQHEKCIRHRGRLAFCAIS